MRIEMGKWYDITAIGRHMDVVRIQTRDAQYLLPFVEDVIGGPTTGGFGRLDETDDVKLLPIRPNKVQHVWITDPELPCPGAYLWTGELRLVRPDHTLVWRLQGLVDDLEALNH